MYAPNSCCGPALAFVSSGDGQPFESGDSGLVVVGSGGTKFLLV